MSSGVTRIYRWGDCHVEDVRIKVPRERGVVMWGLEGGTTPSPEII